MQVIFFFFPSNFPNCLNFPTFFNLISKFISSEIQRSIFFQNAFNLKKKKNWRIIISSFKIDLRISRIFRIIYRAIEKLIPNDQSFFVIPFPLIFAKKKKKKRLKARIVRIIILNLMTDWMNESLHPVF